MLAWLLLGSVSLAGTEEPLRFTWAVVYQGSGRSVLAIDYSSRIAHLSSGDRVRIHFQPRSRCFLYVYLHDAQQDLYLLGQRGFQPPESPEADRSFTLPEGDNWYRLDTSGGVELFYLIVSDHRLRRLEALTSRSLSRPARYGNLPRLSRQRPVLEEIRKLIRESSTLAEPVQKPVTVAGEFRGVTEQGSYQGIEVESGSVYVRTIRLEH
ncbi:MAG: hypothetical protein A2V99_02020 [Spirochaetes bacterium RBG_16_67_19]|nr:MAG: hypothetical protein A2V99_02020 [Spirochaetes bacterium RBG_16_67_19]